MSFVDCACPTQAQFSFHRQAVIQANSRPVEGKVRQKAGTIHNAALENRNLR